MKARIGELTWEEVQGLDVGRTVALLPLGAIEAHGPHLPLETDVLIAEAMVEQTSKLLEKRGWNAIIFPPVVFSPCPFAQVFPGTISLRPEIARELLIDIGSSIAQ